MSKKIGNSEYQIISDMYQNGATQKEIAEQYGVSDATIGNILKKCGVQCKSRKYLSLTYDDVTNMYRMYLSGETSASIGKMYGISEDSVRAWFKKCGFNIKNSSFAHRRYHVNEHYFDSVDTPNKAYILGLLYADGYNMVENREIVLALQETDKHILDSIKDELEYTGPLRFLNYNSKNSSLKNQYSLDITNKNLSEALNRLGVCRNKSLILQWPKWLDEQLYSHFIRGYFDGDGCLYISKTNKSQEVSIIGTEMFVKPLIDMVKKILDVDFYIKNTGDKYKEVTKIVRISSAYGIKKFLDWIYKDADLMLKRKYDKYQQFLNNINNSCCV